MNKTLLMITEQFPYPPTKGTWVDVWGQIVFFHQAGWHVILAFRPSARGNQACSDLPIDITVCPLPEKESRWHLGKDVPTVQCVQNLINQHKPEVVFCQYPHWSSLTSHLELHGAELWFRPHNFELAQLFIKVPNTLSWKFWQSGNLIWLMKWIRLLIYEAPQMFILERQMHRLADRLFFISWGDMKIMSQFYGGNAKPSWVPPFLNKTLMSAQADKDKLDVYYIGVGYDPRSTMQLSGATKLLKQIIPAIEASMPGLFRFHFIGRGSKTYLNDYASDSVVLHDFIDDLSAFLQQMDICCVPVEIGWGCKIKVVEALNSGIPVIGASQAFHGLPPSSGAFFSCQTTEDYVAAFKTLHDAETRRKMATTARQIYVGYTASGQAALTEALDEVSPQQEQTMMSEIG